MIDPLVGSWLLNPDNFREKKDITFDDLLKTYLGVDQNIISSPFDQLVNDMKRYQILRLSIDPSIFYV